VGGLRDRAAPAALVDAVDGDAARGERREEGVVAPEVVAEAVDEDQLGFGGAVGLGWVLVTTTKDVQHG
jgi:hypothetical protein